MQVANKDISVSVQDIDGVMSFGKIFSGKKLKIFYAIFISIVSLATLISLLLFIPGPPYDKDVLACAIGGSCVGGVMLVSAIFLCVYMNFGRKKTLLWLKDAVILRAITQKAKESLVFSYPMIYRKTTAIQLRFSYLGKSYVKNSIQEKLTCSPLYNKYVDKEILIAYSPSTDNVMFIKPKSEQRILAELSK